MSDIFNAVSIFNNTLHSFLVGPIMLAAFIGVGLYFHIKMRFFPIIHIKFWLKRTLFSLFDKHTHHSDNHSLSSFEALFTALAGSMGTGNITGVATAIVAGGPGAVFWMWISAFIGMATKFSENVLGMIYREKNADGKGYHGSPMLYMVKGLKCKPLAVCFAAFCVLASLGLGNMTQGNSVATALADSIKVPPLFCGIFLSAAVAMVIVGGVKRIGKLSSYLIPIVSVIYIACSLIILFANAKNLPAVLSQIISEAFKTKAVGGGVLGYTIKSAITFGISRGVSSNEAGLGSSVMVYASSSDGSPFEQGLWGIFEVFLDTVIVCTITALVILSSGVYDVSLYEDALIYGLPVINGSVLAANAFSSILGPFGDYFISFSMAVYAFATLLTWSHYGSLSCEYLLGAKAVPYYKAVFLFVIIIGCITRLELIWNISDICNCLMAIPNLIALVLLSKKVILYMSPGRHYND